MLNAADRESAPVMLREATDAEIEAERVARRARRGAALKQRRLALGLKQDEAETRARIGSGYLSRVERGLSVPSRRVERQLARAYGCKIADLYQPVVAAAEPEEAGEAA